MPSQAHPVIGKKYAPGASFAGVPLSDRDIFDEQDVLDYEYQKVRVLRPNSMMTMDYRTDRANVYLDEGDIAMKVTKG